MKHIYCVYIALGLLGAFFLLKAPFVEEQIKADDPTDYQADYMPANGGMFKLPSLKEHLPTTVDVAAHERYFPFMYQLRSKANAYLNELLDEMRKKIQQAKSENRILFAQTQEAYYHRLYGLVSNKIDEAFNKISKIIVLAGDFLDDYHAPESDKFALINQTREFAQKLIEPLLTKNLETLRNQHLNP